MKYDIFCAITHENFRRLVINWFSPDIVDWMYYICSFLDEQYLGMFMLSFQWKLQSLGYKSKKISAKEENTFLEEMHIQYIKDRWNERILECII